MINALLLTRWLQVGIFMPVMRVHSTLTATPHWPWLWGADAADAMRKALNWRYNLLPYHYSLAHSLYSKGELISRAMVLDFEKDSYVAQNGASIFEQWMDGPSLLVSPVLNQDNSSSTYLPTYDGSNGWYAWNDTKWYNPGTTVPMDNVALDFVPAFVKSGSVVPLAPAGLQYTDQLPGGALEIHVYAGRNGEFEMVEDDGETTDYQSSGSESTRVTTYTWDDSSSTLSWSVSGNFTGPRVFQSVACHLYKKGSAGVVVSAAKEIGENGSISC